MRILRWIVLSILALLLGSIGFLVLKTLNFSSIQSNYEACEEIAVSTNVSQHLSEALQIKTISNLEASKIDSGQIDQFNGWLAKTFPLADSLLDKKIFNDYAHLYKWEGSKPELAPALLMGHIDVVPVPEENLPSWKVVPFEGTIGDGYNQSLIFINGD